MLHNEHITPAGFYLFVFFTNQLHNIAQNCFWSITLRNMNITKNISLLYKYPTYRLYASNMFVILCKCIKMELGCSEIDEIISTAFIMSFLLAKNLIQMLKCIKSHVVSLWPSWTTKYSLCPFGSSFISILLLNASVACFIFIRNQPCFKGLAPRVYPTPPQQTANFPAEDAQLALGLQSQG